MKLRYSEAFYSVQGEGKFVGVPSVFLRTFGCNFRCMNFGTNETKDRWQQHKEGNRNKAEVKQLIQVVTHTQVSIQNSNTSTNLPKLKK